MCLGDCLTHKKTENSSTVHGRQDSQAIQQSQSCSKRVKSEATHRMLAALCSKCGKRGQQNNFDEEAEVIHGRYSSGLATPLNITGNSVLQFMYLSVKQKSLFKILSDKGEKQSRTFVFHIITRDSCSNPTHFGCGPGHQQTTLSVISCFCSNSSPKPRG